MTVGKDDCNDNLEGLAMYFGTQKCSAMFDVETNSDGTAYNALLSKPEPDFDCSLSDYCMISSRLFVGDLDIFSIFTKDYFKDAIIYVDYPIAPQNTTFFHKSFRIAISQLIIDSYTE